MRWLLRNLLALLLLPPGIAFAQSGLATDVRHGTSLPSHCQHQVFIHNTSGLNWCGDVPDTWFAAVPDSRTVNGHTLSADVTVSASDLSLATIATSGAYGDLSGKPTLAQSLANASHKWLNSYDAATGLFTQTRPDYSDLSGTPTLAQTLTNASHKWFNSYDAATGLFTQTQPDYADLTNTPSIPTVSGTATHTPYFNGSNSIADTPLIYDAVNQHWTATVGYSKIAFGSFISGTQSGIAGGSIMTGGQGFLLIDSANVQGLGFLDSLGNLLTLEIDSGVPKLIFNSTTWTTFAQSMTNVSHKWLNSYNAATGAFTQTQPACADLSDAAASCATDATNASNIGSGTLPAGRLPNPSSSSLGGVQSIATASHNFMTGISTGGVPSKAQPACADISDAAASCATDTRNASNLNSGTVSAARLPTSPSWTSSRGANNPTSTGFGPSTNLMTYQSVRIEYAVTVSTIHFYVQTADNSSSKYDIGLYGPGCNGGATAPLAVDVGAASYTTTGYKSAPIAQGTVTLAPGWYCLAFTGNSNVLKFGYEADVALSAFVNVNGSGSTSGGALNSTLVAPSNTYGLIQNIYYVSIF